MEARNISRLKKKYKKVLKKVYKIHGSKLPISIIDPIEHRDELTGQLQGIEGLKEYVDNQHPLWNDDREAFDQMQDDKKGLSDYFHTRWGRNDNTTLRVVRQNINPMSSLTVLECWKGNRQDFTPTVTDQNLQPNAENQPDVEMDVEAISQEVLEKEWETRLLYWQEVDPVFGEGIDYISTPSSGTLLNQKEFIKKIREKAVEKNWPEDRTEEAIAGFLESAQMDSHYSDGVVGVSKEKGDIILDMEDAYNRIVLDENENRH